MIKTDVFNVTTSKWVSYIKVDGQGVHTLSGRRWNNLITRCSEAYQKTYPQYKGCFNAFEDFQEFVKWSQAQVGYNCEGYELDKDILFPGNKIYAPLMCAFVPRNLNNLFRYEKRSKRSEKHRKERIIYWIQLFQNAEIKIDGRILTALTNQLE